MVKEEYFLGNDLLVYGKVPVLVILRASAEILVTGSDLSVNIRYFRLFLNMVTGFLVRSLDCVGVTFLTLIQKAEMSWSYSQYRVGTILNGTVLAYNLQCPVDISV